MSVADDQSEDADWEGDRDRHRAHGQRGAHQGARGGKGGHSAGAAAVDFRWETDERREDREGLQHRGWERAALGAGAARRAEVERDETTRRLKC